MKEKIEILPKEVWKDVIGYEGLYQVSNLGRVKSISRQVSSNNQYQNCKKIFKSKILNSRLIKNSGYHRVCLSKNGAKKDKYIHRLVAIAFVSNPSGKPEVNHENGDKSDNRALNLKWVTRSENQQHAYRTGLKSALKGEESPLTTLLDVEAAEIKRLSATGAYTNRALAARFGINENTVSMIKNGRKWKHITN